ncbi:hypothetical protein [Calidithermus timidus]|jgi:predicted nucleic acid-binding protein|uniref:hypothetical protein n=1 Tax=Calidithermus timidus TaxID=307124 RepID=UPI0003601782|nr:hypothetical protein [Calidithermus timidus]
MISLDTNVMLSALNPADPHHTRARQLLREHGAAEALTLSPLVYTGVMSFDDTVYA